MPLLRKNAMPYNLRKKKQVRTRKSSAGPKKLPSGSEKGQPSRRVARKQSPQVSLTLGKARGKKALASPKNSRRIVRTFQDFLLAAVKEVMGKKVPRLAPTKRRPRFSDDQIFYKLANAAEEQGYSDSDADEGPSYVDANAPRRFPIPANEAVRVLA